MKEEIEVLLSVMNIKDKEALKHKLKENHITTDVVVVNQVEKQEDKIMYETDKERIYSYTEKGASKSKNRLMEKAKKDICIFADDDMVYEEQYGEMIQQQFRKHKDADMIIFYIKNQNVQREKIKTIGNKTMNRLDILKARTSEIAFRRERLEKYHIQFDEHFRTKWYF